MPREPLRYLHAAQMLLDHQLRDVGPIPPAWQETIQQATISAWDRLVTAAIELNVDFLLLTGNSFAASDHSLTAQVALHAGLQRLDDVGVPVLIIPGEEDLDSAWRLCGAWPENVTRFGGEQGDPVVLEKDGKPLATIHHVLVSAGDLQTEDGVEELIHFAPKTTGPAESHWQIALVDEVSDADAIATELEQSPEFTDQELAQSGIDYWALERGRVRQTWLVGPALAHTPGALQALGPHEIGQFGATLIEVPAEGPCRQTFVPMSRVRYERICCSWNDQLTVAELARNLQDQLAILPQPRSLPVAPPSPPQVESEDDTPAPEAAAPLVVPELWLVECEVLPGGTGPVWQSHDSVQWSQFELALQQVQLPNVTLWLRNVKWVVDAGASVSQDFLYSELLQQLEMWRQSHADPLENMADSFAGSSLAETLPPWLKQADWERIQTRARQLGWNWLQTHKEVA